MSAWEIAGEGSERWWGKGTAGAQSAMQKRALHHLSCEVAD